MNELLSYLENSGIRAGALVLAAALAALLVRLFFSRVLLRLATRTKTDMDDIVVVRLGGPVSASTLIVGCWYALVVLSPSQSVQFVARGALATLAIGVWTIAGIGILRVILERVSCDKRRIQMIEPRTLPVFTFFGQAAIFAAAAYFLFLSWDIDVTGWLASAGIVGIAVGFAAKDTLANLFAGLFIIADGPYQIGDYLVLESGERGRVTDIGMRSTRIQTLDEVQVIIPNANIANSTIFNLSGGPSERMRLQIHIGVAYDSDIEQVRKALLDVAEEIPSVLTHPAPAVRLREFADSSLNFTLLAFVARPEAEDDVNDRLNRAILTRFRKDGIEIPFPQRVVAVHSQAADDGAADLG
jgi:MscS family membrane protein